MCVSLINEGSIQKNHTKINVLHVDDEEDFLTITHLWFERFVEDIMINYNYFTNPQIALEELQKNHSNYDIIISDYQMPVLNGLELLAEIHAKGIEIPFIILTGKGREEVVIEALDLGADRYMTKARGGKSLYAELIHSIKHLHASYTAKKKVKTREELYRTLIESAPDAILNIDLQGRIFFINKQGLILLDYESLEDINQLNIFDLVVEDEREITSQTIHTIIEKNTPIISERTLKRKDGSYFLSSIHAKKVYHPLLGQECLLAIIRDITKTRKLENKIQEGNKRYERQETYYKSIFEILGTPSVILEADKTISLANTAFEHLSGYKRCEIENKKKWIEFVAKEDLERMEKYHDDRRRGSKDISTEYEFVFIDRFGNRKDIYLKVDLIPGTTQSVAALTDITATKQIKKE